MSTLLFVFSLPFKDPVLIFSLVLFIILLAPLLLKKLRIPGIIGLILAGIAIGPNGFNVLLKSSSIELFGTVGLLYIMFLAGLDIDLYDYRKNRNKSIVFGLLTFIIPFGVGIVVSYYFLQYNALSSVLLASMFSTQTLVAYPIVSKLGLTKSESVTIAIGGTIITDTLVMLVLAIVENVFDNNSENWFWLKLIVSLSVFGIAVLWLVPLVSRWVFKTIAGDGGTQYIYVLAMVFASAFMAKLAGIEPIIGAFLAGLALNRLIPQSSALLNRIHFVGNNIFIPFFLINVGMIVDVSAFFKGNEALIVAITIVVVALITKWLAAFLTQKLYKLSVIEGNLLFGLSTAHAAAILAVALVGFNLGLLNENVLNGTIVLILVSCLISSFVTERAARKLTVIESEKSAIMNDITDRILIPVSNTANVEPLIEFIIAIKDPLSTEPVYPLTVVTDDDEAKTTVSRNSKTLEKAFNRISGGETKIQMVTRIDLNIASGIARAIKEKMITKVVMGSPGPSSTANILFGSVLDNLLLYTEKSIWVCHFHSSLNNLKKLCVFIPENAHLEKGFYRWIKVIQTLSRQTRIKIQFYGTATTLKEVEKLFKLPKIIFPASYHPFEKWENFYSITEKENSTALIIVIHARQGTVSHHAQVNDIAQKLTHVENENKNFIIVYPEQNPVLHEDENFQLAGIHTSPIQENLERLSIMGKSISKSFRKKEE